MSNIKTEKVRLTRSEGWKVDRLEMLKDNFFLICDNIYMCFINNFQLLFAFYNLKTKKYVH